MIWLVDDQLLSTVLRGERLSRPVRRGDTVATTGCWYVRLCQAVLGAVARRGVLSGPFLELPDKERTRAIVTLMELPDDIELVSLRNLGPLIGRLRREHRLNALGMEVLAASIHLDAAVLLSVESPKLQDALRAERRRTSIMRAG